MDESTPIPEWLLPSATTLQAFLKEHPNAEREVSESLDKLLEKIDANTGGNVVASLDQYFGPVITDMLFDLSRPELGSHLQEFDKVIPPEAMAFLTRFIKQYGTKLANLSQASNQSSAAALDSFLKIHPDAEQQVREIVSKHLSHVSTSTWGSLITSLDNYWGRDSTNILIDIARQSDQTTRLEETGKFASPEVMSFLRRMISLYGPELATAAVASNQVSNAWKTVFRDVYYDYVNRRPHIRLRIAKYDGEEPMIEGTADSILELAIILMQTIRFLPSPDFIGPTMADRFIREANEFIKFLQPTDSEPSDMQAENQLAK
jgi:hypothetical protein